MPTIAGDFFFTAMPLAPERGLRLLPCGRCGARGPHGFHVEARYGITALCADCRGAECNMTPDEASALVTSGTQFHPAEHTPNR